jgi:hypothetical protein
MIAMNTRKEYPQFGLQCSPALEKTSAFSVIINPMPSALSTGFVLYVEKKPKTSECA